MTYEEAEHIRFTDFPPWPLSFFQALFTLCNGLLEHTAGSMRNKAAQLLVPISWAGECVRTHVYPRVV